MRINRCIRDTKFYRIIEAVLNYPTLKKNAMGEIRTNKKLIFIKITEYFYKNTIITIKTTVCCQENQVTLNKNDILTQIVWFKRQGAS